MKTYVMIPTYNEKENIGNLINGILRLSIRDLHIVVVDDNSPDGTWRIVEDISRKRKNVHLLLRKRDKGRGAAGREGFIYCLKNSADIIVEMDGDMSHDPKYIPSMIEGLKNADLILGSRRIKGGREIGRSQIRKIITFFANLYIRIVLGLKAKDCNSGYRCFTREAMRKINPYNLKSKGPSIVQEVLFKAHLKGAKIKEIPITFVNRTKGKSKLGIKQMASGYFMVLKLRFLKLIGEI